LAFLAILALLPSMLDPGGPDQARAWVDGAVRATIMSATFEAGEPHAYRRFRPRSWQGAPQHGADVALSGGLDGATFLSREGPEPARDVAKNAGPSAPGRPVAPRWDLSDVQDGMLGAGDRKGGGTGSGGGTGGPGPPHGGGSGGGGPGSGGQGPGGPGDPGDPTGGGPPPPVPDPTPVPEPAAWGLMIVGIGVVAGRLRALRARAKAA
jgi:hypothetical protein